MIIQGLDFDDITLRWPRELFIHEAKQILLRSDRPEFPERVSVLSREAFVDADIERTVGNATAASAWTVTPDDGNSAKAFLEYRIANPKRLRGYTRRAYYAERLNSAELLGGTRQIGPLATSFSQIVLALRVRLERYQVDRASQFNHVEAGESLPRQLCTRVRGAGQ